MPGFKNSSRSISPLTYRSTFASCASEILNPERPMFPLAMSTALRRRARSASVMVMELATRF